MQTVLSRLRQTLASFLHFLRSYKKTLILILTVAVITLLISTTISLLLNRIDNLHIPSLSNIKTLGVEAYWDNNTQNKVEEIDWGTMWLGSSNNVTIYLLSVSTTDTTLKLTDENLTLYNTNQIAIKPAENISTHMHLNWNYNGSTLESGDVIQVTLTLRTDYSRDFASFLIENDIKRFSLDILIRTREYVT